MSKENLHVLPIGSVERETGLSKDILRKWELRYGFPQPLRSEGGERLFTARDVDRLRKIKLLLDCGMRPGQVVPLTELALTEIQNLNISLLAADSRDATTSAVIQQLKCKDPKVLVSIFKDLLIRQGLKDFVQDTVAKLSISIGDAWARGELSPFQEHVFTATLHNFLTIAIAGVVSQPHGRKVLLTTPPGELHGLGLLMIEALFTLQGFDCLSLGTQTAAHDVASASQFYGVDLIAISMSAHYPKRQVLPFLQTLRNQLPETTLLWAGGGALKGRRINVPGVTTYKNLGAAFSAMHAMRLAVVS